MKEVKLDDVHPEIRKLAVSWGEAKHFDMIETMQLGIQIQYVFNKRMLSNEKEYEEGYKEGHENGRPKWIEEKLKKPEFGKPVLCWCRIWGRYIGTYERLDPDYDWGNWSDGKSLGCLPPVYWSELLESPK